MIINLSIDPKKTTEEIVSFIQRTVNNSGFSKVVIGLSGGIDSSVSCVLAVEALGKENVYIALFPYGELNKEGVEDAKLLIKQLNIPQKNITQIDIKPWVDPIVSWDHGIDDLRKGNIMVRMRMILLYDLSKKFQTLVMGTENRSEYLLGYFTRFGDEASDLEPLRGLYKTQIKQLAKTLGIPEKIIQKTPTAGMWNGQTDEGELGFSYEDADRVLHLYFDLHKKKEEIFNLVQSKEIVEKVLNRVGENQFKHSLPYKL